MKNHLTGKLLGPVLLSLVVLLASPLLQAKKPLVQKQQTPKTDVCHYPGGTPPGHSISVRAPLLQGHITGHGECLLEDSFGPERECFCASFLGISSSDDKIYAINVDPDDTDACSAGLIADTSAVVADSLYGPNGLAYDPDNNRIYFAVVPDDCVKSAHDVHNAKLYFVEAPFSATIDQAVFAHDLDECPHDATWFIDESGEGAYYYLGPDHDNLREVFFNTGPEDGETDRDGGERSLASVVSSGTLIFGDIAVKLDAMDITNVPDDEIGLVFMSATSTIPAGASTYTFHIQPYIAETGEVPAACLSGVCVPDDPDKTLQLAFHNNGFTTVLYGYENATNTIFLVDESNGFPTLVCDPNTVTVMGFGFNDISPFETSVQPPPPE